MNNEKVIREMVERKIAVERMFTSIDIANSIKRNGNWISNSNVAEFLRTNFGMLARFGYMDTMIRVDSGSNIFWARLYHSILSCPDTYLARDQRGISPDQFKDLYEPKPKKEKIEMDVTKEIVVADDNGVVWTDTKTLAETFKKRHGDVLRKIEDLGCSDKFAERNFALVEIIEKNGIGGGIKRKSYKMTLDGFTMVVMGFTGKKAMSFKEQYIKAFRDMEKYIREQGAFKIPQTYAEALMLAGKLAEKIELDAPKVQYHDTVKEIGTGVLLGTFSKILAPEIITGQNTLFRYLRDEGILQSRKGPLDPTWNMPYQQFLDQGFFTIKEGTRKSTSEGTKFTYTTYITGRGQIWLTKKLRKFMNE